MLSLDSVDGQCLNCQRPRGPYCCATGAPGQPGNCCEFPLDDWRPEKFSNLSPLAQKLAKKTEDDIRRKMAPKQSESIPSRQQNTDELPAIRPTASPRQLGLPNPNNHHTGLGPVDPNSAPTLGPNGCLGGPCMVDHPAGTHYG